MGLEDLNLSYFLNIKFLFVMPYCTHIIWPGRCKRNPVTATQKKIIFVTPPPHKESPEGFVLNPLQIELIASSSKIKRKKIKGIISEGFHLKLYRVDWKELVILKAAVGEQLPDGH